MAAICKTDEHNKNTNNCMRGCYKKQMDITDQLQSTSFITTRWGPNFSCRYNRCRYIRRLVTLHFAKKITQKSLKMVRAGGQVEAVGLEGPSVITTI